MRQGRPLARTTPVALDRPTPVTGARFLAEGYGRLGRNGLVVLVAVAVGAVVLVGVVSGGFFRGGASPTPSALAVGTTQSPNVTEQLTPRASASPAATRTPRPTRSRRPQPETYRVRPGDNLSEIAERFDTTVDVLVELNGIDNPSQLRVGQVLQLPDR